MYYRNVKRVAHEDALLRRAKPYDAQALVTIYDIYAFHIYAYIYRWVGDAMRAERAVGEVFARAERDSILVGLADVGSGLAVSHRAPIVVQETALGLVAERH